MILDLLAAIGLVTAEVVIVTTFVAVWRSKR